MTKDYAKRRRREVTVKSRGHIPAANIVLMPTWAWMITGLTLGLTLAAMLYWKLNAKHQLPQTATISVEEIDSEGTKKQRVAASSEDEKSNRFDFYTVLPNMTMDVPESTANAAPAPTHQPAIAAQLSAPTTTLDLATKAEPQATTTTADAQTKVAPETSFIVQVGAFRTLLQAEEFKAQLALSGLQASVQTFQKSPSETWHRVYVGPFTDKSRALAMQQRLQQTQALHSLVLKMRV